MQKTHERREKIRQAKYGKLYEELQTTMDDLKGFSYVADRLYSNDYRSVMMITIDKLLLKLYRKIQKKRKSSFKNPGNLNIGWKLKYLVNTLDFFLAIKKSGLFISAMAYTHKMNTMIGDLHIKIHNLETKLEAHLPHNYYAKFSNPK